MKLFESIDHWADVHHARLLDFLRMLLGLTIFIKGLYFISHTEELQLILRNSKFPWLSFAMAHYVAMAHLAGGILIMIGLFTRLACAFQIPVLLGAVLFVNAQKGFYYGNTDLAFSIVVLCMLVFFFIYGSGYVSADHTWREEEQAKA